ncbi:CBO0543 family protein [Sutcliffiella deserti]|uniref:CBO0543 family protein n=1 Tax=Sutcliffiella deserti TaxID=2875501 RepID=UPI001CBB989F|nr:CBO0543 family protein [Sutcliffiella deserti]
MHILITILAILAAWRWADWSRFSAFHATILYMSAMDLLYLVLTVDDPLWILKSNIGVPHTIVTLLYTFVVFPSTVMLFLSNYPDIPFKKLFHYAKWIFIYIGVEWIGYLTGAIYYKNSWTLGWSLLFLIVMFPMLRLHFKKPILSYLLSFFIIVFLLYWFQVPLKH